MLEGSVPPELNGTMYSQTSFKFGLNQKLSVIDFEALQQIDGLTDLEMPMTGVTTPFPSRVNDRWRPQLDFRFTNVVWRGGKNSRGENLPEYFTFAQGDLKNEVETVHGQPQITNMLCPEVSWLEKQNSSVYTLGKTNILDDIDGSTQYSRNDVKFSAPFYNFQRCNCARGFRMKTYPQKEIRRFDKDTVDAVMEVKVCEAVKTNVLTTIFIVVGSTLGVLGLMLLIVFIFFRRELARMRINYVKRRGPPREGEPLVIVATDVQGSTELWEWNSQAMAQATNIHDVLLRRLLPDHFGYEIVTEGDSFLCAFHDAVDATRWALQVQAELMEAPWPEDLDRNEHSANEVRSLVSEKLCAREEDGKGTASPRGELPAAASSKSSRSPTRPARDRSFEGDLSSKSFSSGMKVAWAQLAKSRRRILEIGKQNSGDVGGERAEPSTREPPPDCATTYRGLRVRIGICSGPAEFVGKMWRRNTVVYTGGSASRAPMLADCFPGGHIAVDGPTADAITEAGLESVVSWETDEISRPRKGASGRLPSIYKAGRTPASSGHMGLSRIGFTPSTKSQKRSAPSGFSLHMQDLKNQPAKVLSLGEVLLKDGTTVRVTVVCLARLALRFRDLEGIPCASEEVDPRGTGVIAPGFFHAPAVRAALDVHASSIFYGHNSGNANRDDLNSSAPSPELPPVTVAFAVLEGLGAARSKDASAAKTLIESTSHVLRVVLLRFGGYWCQSGDGNWMYAFRSASDALSFALAAQIALLQYPWSKEVLALDVCCEAAPDAQGCPTLRGPRVNVGVYEGVPSMVVPHPSMGRADYFGPLVNRAARLCFGAARGGQVVADKATAKQAVDEWRERGGTYVDRSRHGWAFPESDELLIQVLSVGRYRFKGVAGEVSCVQVVADTLAPRLDYWKKCSLLLGSHESIGKSYQTNPESGLLHAVPLRLPRCTPDSVHSFARCIKSYLNNDNARKVDPSHPALQSIDEAGSAVLVGEKSAIFEEDADRGAPGMERVPIQGAAADGT